MPKVVLKENEELDTMLKRFKRQVRDAGIMEECSKREFFVPKSMKRKLKSKQAKIKNRK